MANKIPDGALKKFKEDLITELHEKIYRTSTDLAQDVGQVNKLEKSGERETIAKQVEEIETFLKHASPKSSADAKQKYKEAKLKKEGLLFMISRLNIRRSDMYKRIDQNSRTIKALWNEIIFIESFDMEKMPQLEYIEIDGTQYEAENNGIKRAEDGSKVLFLISKSNGTATAPAKK